MTSDVIGRIKSALEPFALAARGMYTSGDCSGNMPVDWPDRWLLHICTTEGQTPISAGLPCVLKVADFNRASEALRLIEARGGEDGWLPIETAPKDGTRIVAYPVTMNEAGVVSWEPPSRTPPMMRIVSGENHDQDGFWRVLLSMKPSPYPPTHWRPLPVPPTLKDTGK